MKLTLSQKSSKTPCHDKEEHLMSQEYRTECSPERSVTGRIVNFGDFVDILESNLGM